MIDLLLLMRSKQPDMCDQQNMHLKQETEYQFNLKSKIIYVNKLI